jgi:glycosyltransferase involved in cell wall biosynthesis
MSDELPLISIVTPSLNQGPYLRQAMQSVLSQGDVRLEYVVIDGGSQDGSAAIIEEMAADPRLIYWYSEPDAGHYDALNKGFARTSGEIMAWLNSDDLYLPQTLSLVASLFHQFPQIEWLTTTQHVHFNTRGELILCRYVGGYNKQSFWRGSNLISQPWFGRAMIQQESTFWRRSLWERAGGRVQASLSLAGDFELWSRFFKLADLYAVDVPLAGMRKHDKQQTAAARDAYLAEASAVFLAAGGRPYGRLQTFLRRGLWIIAGHRSCRKLPRRLLYLLTAAGILYPTKVCVWQEGRWLIADDCVI